jgi:hypothetical protein
MEIAEIVKRKNAAQKYVHDNLDRKEIIMQLAEEASELSQSCLKYIRALDGKNPFTEFDPEFYMDRIIERYSCVLNAAEAARIWLDFEAITTQAERWADRLKALKESEGADHE